MGRPRGAPTRRKEFRLEERQVEYLEALIEVAPIGKPTLVSIIRQAVDDFIALELSKPDVRQRVDRILREQRKVVNLHDVSKEREPPKRGGGD